MRHRTSDQSLLLFTLLLLVAGLVAALAWRGLRSGPGDPMEPAGGDSAQTLLEGGSSGPGPGSPIDSAPPRSTARARAPGAHPADGLRGRVLDAEAGAGIAGFEVELGADGAELLRATSGPDGLFVLAGPGHEGDLLEVHAPPGWQVHNRRFHLRAPHLVPGTEIQIRASRLGRAPFVAQLLDRETGEPVPWFTLAVYREGRLVEVLTSDAEGRCATREALPEGLLDLGLVDHPARLGTWLDHPGRLETHRHPGEGSPAVVEIPVGPTYRLVLSNAVESQLAGLEAFLLADFQRIPTERDRREGTGVRQEGGGLPWVRFPIEPVFMRGERPRTLLVGDAERMLVGTAEVARLRGIEPEPVPIELTAAGALRGHVRGEDGAAIADLQLRIGHHRDVQGPMQVAVDAAGRFELWHLPPGEYELQASSPRHLDGVQRVLVRPGERTGCELELATRPIGGAISGLLHSARGRLEGRITVVAENLDDSRVRIYARVEAPEGGSTEPLPFELADLPQGRYRVSVATNDLAWGPAELVVEPPARGLSFLRRDDVPLLDLGFRVFDAETGERVRRYTVAQRIAERPAEVSGRQGDAVFCRGLPEGAPLVWRVQAEGYASVQGDFAAFVEQGGTEERPQRWAEVHLLKGWSARLEVRGPDGPLEGARLLIDGSFAGESDAEGSIEVFWETEPERVEFEHDELEHAGGEVDAYGRLSGAGLPAYRVVFG